MKLASVAVLAAIAAPAIALAAPIAVPSAGDLPADLTLDLADGVLRTGTLEIPLLDLVSSPSSADEGCETTIASARYDRARHALVLDEQGCGTGKHTIAKRQLLALLARARAWDAETRGDLAAARAQWAAALAAVPDDERGALDLARVELALGDRAAAMAAVRRFTVKAPVAHYASYLSNAVFQPLLDDPALAALRATPPGDAQVRGIGGSLVAYSAKHALLAVLRDAPIGDDCAGDRHDVVVAILDAGGREVASFSLVPPPLLDGAWSNRHLLAYADEVAARLGAANRFLRDLGFSEIPGLEVARFTVNKRGTEVARFPAARLGIAAGDGTLRLLDGNRTLGEHHLYRCPADHFACNYPPTLLWAAWLPAQRTVLVSWVTSGAEHSDRNAAIDLWKVPAP